MKSPQLPINLEWRKFDKKGNSFLVRVEVIQTNQKERYPPDGIKAVFKVFKMAQDEGNRLICLIDNHEPFGFHEHDRLPFEHDSRTILHVKNWQEAWSIFDQKLKEIFYEA